jgi:hypothetical protein
MSECFLAPPLHIRKTGDQWEGANREGGPWRPIPAPLWFVPGQDAAPARGLLERVESVLAQVEPEQNGFTSEDKAARAAIREIAAWLDQRGQHGCSLWLREEADR